MLFSICREGAENTAPWNQRYESLNDAAEALRVAMGWSEIVLAPGYTEPDGGEEWKAYRDIVARDEGSRDAPSVRRGAVAANPVI